MMRGMPVDARRRRRISILFTLGCVIGYLALAFPRGMTVVKENEALDFASYYYGLRVALDGANPYDLSALSARARVDGLANPVHPFFYPPPALLMFLPAAPLPLLDAAVWMYVLNNLALVAVGCALWVLLGRSKALVPALALILITYSPIQANNQWGQVNSWVLLLVILGLIFIRGHRDLPGGFLLGVAAMVKISPFLFIVWMAYKRRWRVVTGAVVAAVVLTLVSLPLVAPRYQLHFYSQVLPEFQAGGNYSGLSISLHSVGIHSVPRLWHLFFPNPASKSVLSPAAAAASSLSALGLIGWLAMALRTRHRDLEVDRYRFALQAGAVMVLMVILPSFTYEHHLVFLLLPIVALAASIASGRVAIGWQIALAAAYIVLAAPRSLQQASYDLARSVPDPMGWLLRGVILEVKLVAALVLLAACAASARKPAMVA